jgi:hypothetical protein
LKTKLTFGVATLALALVGAAAADTTGSMLTLQPVSHGALTHANWQAQVGRPDSQGDGNQALVLEAPGTPDTSAAGLVRGFEGTPVRDLLSLAYEHRVPGTCTKSDPRWAVFIRGRTTKRYLLNLGCAVTPGHTTDDPSWIRRVFAQPTIDAEIVRQLKGGAKDALLGTVDELALVVDRSKGPAYLDNIAVRSRAVSKLWTYAGDNSNGVPGTPPDFSADDLAMIAALLPDEALWDEADVLASVTPEERVMIDEANAATG